MNSIIDLQETSPNHWKAKYRGNYGIYTIKIETDGKKTRNFSCSCPSDYYPCKHIPIVQNAINDRIIKSKKKNEAGLFEDVVRKMSLKDLQEFVIRFGLHNPSFQQAILLDFAPLQKQSENNQYSDIIRNGLEGIYFDFEDIYDYNHECFEIDVLDQWLNKAREYLRQGNYPEAILIAKACIEEYAEWMKTIDSGVDDYISEEYIYGPFNILEEAYENGHVNAKELMTYCKGEVGEKKYQRNFHDSFDTLIMQLTEDTDPKGYLAMQDRLFNSLSDKTSYEAKTIIDRKIDFYKKQGDATTAWKIVEENIQFEAFRKEIVQKRIAENSLKEAKRLINEYIQAKTKETDNSYFGNRYSSYWDELLLDIAKKENNEKVVRSISRKFLDSSFDVKYYKIYKSTFSADTWPAELEKLIKHYQKRGRNWFITSVADIFVEEKQIERLLAYLAGNLRIEYVNRYYKFIGSEFPQETLALFKQAIDIYMRNAGREIYENTINYFKSMLTVEGGKELVKQMITDYKVQYKSRKAMIEIFDRFNKS